MTDRYLLLSEIGRGAMGVVWKARDDETGEIVALKLLREIYSEDAGYRKRFERELALARRIDSINVVKMLGFGDRDGRPYLVLEYVEGRSLNEVLIQHGAYDWPEAQALLAQLAQGLADANAAGVIHRDIKPSNVLLATDGTAKLTDFGIARGLDLTRMTATSTIMGTPAYLAPEGPKDARSDLYSLGIIGYELLTGELPFRGTTYQEIIVAHIREAPDLARLPEEARPLIGWLLAKNPADRPQRASALLPVLYGAAKAPPVAGSLLPHSPQETAVEAQAPALPSTAVAVEDAPTPTVAPKQARRAIPTPTIAPTRVMPPDVPLTQVMARLAQPPALEPPVSGQSAVARGRNAALGVLERYRLRMRRRVSDSAAGPEVGSEAHRLRRKAQARLIRRVSVVAAIVAALVCVPAGVAGWSGVVQVPIFSELFGLDRAQDLGMQRDPQELDRFCSQYGITRPSLPADYTLDNTHHWSGNVAIDGTISEAALGSLPEISGGTHYVTGINFRIHAGYAEVAAFVESVPGYPFSGPVYGQFSLERTGPHSIRVVFSHLDFGHIGIPGNIVGWAEDQLNSSLSQMIENSGISIDELELREGEVYFKGTFPQTITADSPTGVTP
jgi:hypothetical protein